MASIISSSHEQNEENFAFSLEAVIIRTQGYLPTLQKRWDELKAAKTTSPSDVPVWEGIQHARGKVRDRFWKENDDSSTVLVLYTTDRQSGFDRDLCVVPYKGAVLNLCSVFWFQQTRDIIGNHFINAPHPSVSLVRKCSPFPIEFVVRYVAQKNPNAIDMRSTFELTFHRPFAQKILLDRFDLDFDLEALRGRRTFVLRSCLGRRHEKESTVAEAFINTHH